MLDTSEWIMGRPHFIYIYIYIYIFLEENVILTFLLSIIKIKKKIVENISLRTKGTALNTELALQKSAHNRRRINNKKRYPKISTSVVAKSTM